MPDLITLEDLAALEEEEREVYLEGILHAGQIVMFIGQQKAGKSYFLDQILLHAAAGEDWGEKIEIPKPRRSLVVQTEGSDWDLEERTLALYKKYPLAQQNWAAYMPDILDLRKGDGVPALEAKIEEFEPEIVGIDSLYTSMSGSVRVDSDITDVKMTLRKIQIKHPKISFIILHHEHRAKRNPDGNLYETSTERYAGSYQIMAMADVSWHLTLDANQHKETRYFEVANMRSRHMGIDPFFVEMDESTGILSSGAYDLSDAILGMRLHLKTQSIMEKTEFMDWCIETKKFAKASVYKNIKKMMDAKHVIETIDGQGVKSLEWVGE